jgi:hypothetical protein
VKECFELVKGKSGLIKKKRCPKGANLLQSITSTFKGENRVNNGEMALAKQL